MMCLRRRLRNAPEQIMITPAWSEEVQEVEQPEEVRQALQPEEVRQVEKEEEERRQTTTKPLLLLLPPEDMRLEPEARFQRLLLVEVDAAVCHPFSNFVQLEEGNVYMPLLGL